MNVTELARRLKIPTQELRDTLPQLGFDVGQRAIKIPDHLAHKIINNWRELKSKLERIKAREAEEVKKQEQKLEEEPQEKKEIQIPSVITVREFAQKLELPVTHVIQELMKNGVLTNLNERIDFDTASIIADDLGFKVTQIKEAPEEFTDQEAEELLIKQHENEASLAPRPPVVVVMGHVDHGKTKLLDAVRKTNVVDQEAGSITQHIGAYQVKKNGQKITFIDTPGHEAFTTMRSRGARVADIAILVIAADDGIKPQTLEAIKIIQNAKLPLIVAINKIDKPEANLEKVKQELAQQNLLPEDWGGQIICVPISAKEGTGINDLLEMVLLVAEMEKKKIRANPKQAAVGTVVEFHIDKGEGPVATILVQAGTLRVNDILSASEVYYGKVRAMKNFRGREIKEATPGTPVKVIGLKAAPQVGDILVVSSNLKSLVKKTKADQAVGRQLTTSITTSQISEEERKNLVTYNLILKTDVLGSLEAIILNLEKLSHPEVKVNIINKGLGNLTETDVLQAEATGAVLIGFNVRLASGVEELAQEVGVEVKSYQVIYDLINEVKDELEKLLTPELLTVELGKMQVLAIFRQEKKGMIVGGKIIKGRVEPKARVKVMRKGEEIATGEVDKLQSGKEVVSLVEAGGEAGIKFIGEPVIEIEDVLEFYKEERKIKKI